MLYHNYCDLLLCNIIDVAGVCERNFGFTKNYLGSTARIFVFFISFTYVIEELMMSTYSKQYLHYVPVFISSGTKW